MCDGTNGTPDLRNKFVVGSGDTYSPSDFGGDTQHKHTFTGDGHGHDLLAGTDLFTVTGFVPATIPSPTVGTTDNADSRPPYYSLAFIMYVGVAK